MSNRQQSTWSVLTNHSRVLAAVAADPDIRVRDIATLLGVTERTVLRIIGDLEDSGHLTHDRVGARNRYEIIAVGSPGPTTPKIEAEVLAAILGTEGKG
jgi:DNA-binding MarR family transcriptional regulator